MRISDLTDLYSGHIVVKAKNETGKMYVLYDSRISPDLPFDVCFMEINTLFPKGNNLLEVWVNV